MRRPLYGLLPSTVEILHCLLRVATATVVISQVSVMIFYPGVKQPLDRLRRTLVQHLAPLDQHGVVSHLLRERVLEGILRLRKGRLLVDELSSLEVGELCLKIRFRFAHYQLEQTKGKFFAHDGQGL